MSEIDLAEKMKEVEVVFIRHIKVQDFIQEIRERLSIFDGKREKRNKNANLNMLNSYERDIEGGKNTILYEYTISFNRKKWK